MHAGLSRHTGARKLKKDNSQLVQAKVKSLAFLVVNVFLFDFLILFLL